MTTAQSIRRAREPGEREVWGVVKDYRIFIKRSNRGVMAAVTRNLGIVMWRWEVTLPIPAILVLKPTEITASETAQIWGFLKIAILAS